MEGQGLGLLRQRGPFLSPSSLAVLLWGISSRGCYCMFIALVSLPDLSQIKSHVRSGTELTSVYTPAPAQELEVGTLEVPGGNWAVPVQSFLF